MPSLNTGSIFTVFGILTRNGTLQGGHWGGHSTSGPLSWFNSRIQTLVKIDGSQSATYLSGHLGLAVVQAQTSRGVSGVGVLTELLLIWEGKTQQMLIAFKLNLPPD